MGMLICPKCSARNASHLVICGSCGAILDQEKVESDMPDTGSVIAKHSPTAKIWDAEETGMWVVATEHDPARNINLLRTVVGPGMTLAALLTIGSHLWMRSLTETLTWPNLMDRSNDLDLASNLFTVGLLSFLSLTAFAVYLLATDHR